MQCTGAKILMECLVEQGVDTIFGYPGGTILNVYDELYNYEGDGRIKHILTAHEQGACHAADGYARSTGRVGVCFATSGPGCTNLVTGIATAYMDSSPIVCITCNVGTSLLGKDSFQEVDITGITMPITKCNYLVRSVDELADVVREAFAIARSGRPGPVLIDIPKNVTAEKADYEPLPRSAHGTSGRLGKLMKRSSQNFKAPEPDHRDIDKLVEMIAASKKPLLICGGGVVRARAHHEFEALANRIDSPVAITVMGAGGFRGRNPLTTGMIGMHGSQASNMAVDACDLLIAVGCRFSDRVALNPKTFAKNATIIQIDIDASELGKNVDVDLSIVGDAAYVLNAMLPQIKPAKHPDWMTMIQSWQAQDYHPVSDPTRLMPHQVIGEVCNQCGPDAVYVTDVGQHQMWAAQYLRHTKSRGFITSGGLGTMGFGYGAAIGAQMALGRQQRVVMFTGDASFHMNLNEACTAVSYELPIITVIFNNSVLGMVRQWQTSFYGKRYSQTDPHRKTDFVKLADGFGLKGYRCTNLPEFQQAFAEALQRKGPTWIECIIDKDEKVLPMIPGGGDINDIIME